MSESITTILCDSDALQEASRLVDVLVSNWDQQFKLARSRKKGSVTPALAALHSLRLFAEQVANELQFAVSMCLYTAKVVEWKTEVQNWFDPGSKRIPSRYRSVFKKTMEDDFNVLAKLCSSFEEDFFD